MRVSMVDEFINRKPLVEDVLRVLGSSTMSDGAKLEEISHLINEAPILEEVCA